MLKYNIILLYYIIMSEDKLQFYKQLNIKLYENIIENKNNWINILKFLNDVNNNINDLFINENFMNSIELDSNVRMPVYNMLKLIIDDINFDEWGVEKNTYSKYGKYINPDNYIFKTEFIINNNNNINITFFKNYENIYPLIKKQMEYLDNYLNINRSYLKLNIYSNYNYVSENDKYVDKLLFLEICKVYLSNDNYNIIKNLYLDYIFYTITQHQSILLGQKEENEKYTFIVIIYYTSNQNNYYYYDFDVNNMFKQIESNNVKNDDYKSQLKDNEYKYNNNNLFTDQFGNKGYIIKLNNLNDFNKLKTNMNIKYKLDISTNIKYNTSIKDNNELIKVNIILESNNNVKIKNIENIGNIKDIDKFINTIPLSSFTITPNIDNKLFDKDIKYSNFNSFRENINRLPSKNKHINNYNIFLNNCVMDSFINMISYENDFNYCHYIYIVKPSENNSNLISNDCIFYNNKTLLFQIGKVIDAFKINLDYYFKDNDNNRNKIINNINNLNLRNNFFGYITKLNNKDNYNNELNKFDKFKYITKDNYDEFKNNLNKIKLLTLLNKENEFNFFINIFNNTIILDNINFDIINEIGYYKKILENINNLKDNITYKTLLLLILYYDNIYDIFNKLFDNEFKTKLIEKIPKNNVKIKEYTEYINNIKLTDLCNYVYGFKSFNNDTFKLMNVIIKNIYSKLDKNKSYHYNNTYIKYYDNKFINITDIITSYEKKITDYTTKINDFNDYNKNENDKYKSFLIKDKQNILFININEAIKYFKNDNDKVKEFTDYNTNVYNFVSVDKKNGNKYIDISKIIEHFTNKKNEYDKIITNYKNIDTNDKIEINENQFNFINQNLYTINYYLKQPQS